ncbi:MAG: CHASE domain-containing protein [Magnetospirillum sp.]|nr:CHASE domain-containing protein [Magnetospirillum sp.]
MALVCLAWLGLSLWVLDFYAGYRETQMRAQASALSVSATGALTNALNQRLALVRGLAAFVAVKAASGTTAELDREFPTFAAAYYQQVPGIRNISVAPDFTVQWVYPTDPGNLKVIGNNILEDKRPGFAEVVNRSIQTRGLAVHEPVEMIQGGLGLLARHAVFVGDRPWGAVGMAFNMSSLLESSRIGILEGYAWGLRSAAGSLVGGDSKVFAMEPVTTRIDLPDGYWDFALAPLSGWREAATTGAEMTALRLALLILGCGLLELAWLQMRSRDTLEKLVESRTRALSAANSELERFSFIVAHDLQEPLRSIISFSQLVERGLNHQLNDEQRQWLSGLGIAARLMKSLLHDVQIYLGASSVPLPKRAIPAAEALGIAQRKLSGQIAKTKARIEVEPLPQVWADHHRLGEVFTALISNALEYCSPERPPHIRISARYQDNFVIIDIADNGLGIEESYFDRIFEVFQRLHARSAHPGTGMGLAIGKKMIEHLGGTIRVRSVVGEGSVFSVYLPVDPAQNEMPR